MLPAAGVSAGWSTPGSRATCITTPERLTELSGRPSSEILRLERSPRICSRRRTVPGDFPDAFRAALQAAADSTGRGGHQDDCGLPQRIRHRLVAADRCRCRRTRRRSLAAHGPLRVDEPRADRVRRARGRGAGLPIQVHVGFGDRDLDLHRTDPMLLLPLLRSDAPGAGAAVALLPVPPAGRLSGAGLRQRELRRGPGDQLSRRRGRGWSPRRWRPHRSPSSSTPRTPSGRPSCTCSARCCGAAPWALVLGGWVRAGDCTEQDAIRIVGHDRRAQRRAGAGFDPAQVVAGLLEGAGFSGPGSAVAFRRGRRPRCPGRGRPWRRGWLRRRWPCGG